VIDAEDRSADIAPFVAKGVTYVVEPIVRENMAAVLSRYAGPGDLILNLSVEVSSLDVMNWCQEHRVLYLDTCLEPWANYYANPKIPEDERTNYFLRYSARENAKKWPKGATSALVTHGANPGLISHLVKQALLEIAGRRNLPVAKPKSKEEWAGLARRLGTPSTTPRSPTGRNGPANSSTPGAFPDSAARALSHPSSAGAAMRRACRQADASIASAPRTRSFSTSRAASPRCDPGRPSAARCSGSSSPTGKPSPSATT
jgi:hypothetical protein